MYILKNVMFYISKTNHVHLIGKVYNHPIYDDGTEVVTSELVDATRPAGDSTLFTTKSGSHYSVNMKDIEGLEIGEEE